MAPAVGRRGGGSAAAAAAPPRQRPWTGLPRRPTGPALRLTLLLLACARRAAALGGPKAGETTEKDAYTKRVEAVALLDEAIKEVMADKTKWDATLLDAKTKALSLVGDEGAQQILPKTQEVTEMLEEHVGQCQCGEQPVAAFDVVAMWEGMTLRECKARCELGWYNDGGMYLMTWAIPIDEEASNQKEEFCKKMTKGSTKDAATDLKGYCHYQSRRWKDSVFIENRAILQGRGSDGAPQFLAERDLPLGECIDKQRQIQQAAGSVDPAAVGRHGGLLVKKCLIVMKDLGDEKMDWTKPEDKKKLIERAVSLLRDVRTHAEDYSVADMSKYMQPAPALTPEQLKTQWDYITHHWIKKPVKDNWHGFNDTWKGHLHKLGFAPQEVPTRCGWKDKDSSLKNGNGESDFDEKMIFWRQIIDMGKALDDDGVKNQDCVEADHLVKEVFSSTLLSWDVSLIMAVASLIRRENTLPEGLLGTAWEVKEWQEKVFYSGRPADGNVPFKAEGYEQRWKDHGIEEKVTQQLNGLQTCEQLLTEYDEMYPTAQARAAGRVERKKADAEAEEKAFWQARRADKKKRFGADCQTNDECKTKYCNPVEKKCRLPPNMLAKKRAKPIAKPTGKRDRGFKRFMFLLCAVGIVFFLILFVLALWCRKLSDTLRFEEESRRD